MQTTLDELMSQYVDTVRAMDGLVLRCLGLVDDGDDVAYYIHDAYTFQTGKQVEQDLVLNNPFDSTFFGMRLNLFLESRLVDESGAGNSQLTFRPDDWTCVNDYPQSTNLNATNAVNCSFAIRTSSGPYSSAPLSIAHAFSTRQGVSGAGHVAVSAYLGGLDFHRDYPIPRGEAMIVKVTPLFTRPVGANGLIADLTSVQEYKVVATLQGYKVARGFR